MVFKIFLLYRFHLVFLPISLASLPPGVMILNCSTAPRDSATDIEKTARKGAPERERPNRSTVKMDCFVENEIFSVSDRTEHVLSPSIYHTVKDCFRVEL